MRYLIFNVTVLAALGYLFMASPDQSFANWIGKAPQMFDAARTAGRVSMPGDDPTSTAGRALLKAVEPVVEQVLSSSDDAIAAPPPTARFGEPATTDEIRTAAVPADLAPADTQPVTMQDIESIIRDLLDGRVTAGDDQDTGAVVDSAEIPAGNETGTVKPQRQGADRPSTGLASGIAPADQSMPTNATPNEAADAGIGGVDIADTALTAPSAVSKDMTDEEIAAAFARLQQEARPDPAPSGTTQPTEMAAADDGRADGASAEAGVVTSAPVALASPAFMSSAQRADSLAIMVEELQLMYLERTGG
jgi:hypothetical protein